MIERASPDDLMQLAADVGPVREQVGAVVVVDASDSFDARRAAQEVADRLGTIPRLRQLLTRSPIGCGRPIWVDDPTFDPRRHVEVVPCPAPGDEAALLCQAVALVTTPLPPGAPPWHACVVTGITGSRAAVVVLFHHVLADGIGGLAVLERLVDTPGAVTTTHASPLTRLPRPAPTPRQLAAEAWAARATALIHLPSALRTLSREIADTRRTRLPRVSPSSLNRPTGPRRRAVVVRARLDEVRATAHRGGATVNDVLLAAVAGALRELVHRRGEPDPVLVASVPVARRLSTTTTELGNQLGGIVVPLPVCVDRSERLRLTAAATRARKDAPGGALVRTVFRSIGALRLTHRFIYHQHMVSTFITDLRGPEHQLTFVGEPVLEIVPISHLTGNVTTTFAALSYDGTLVVTVTADPDTCPDLDDLAELLHTELDGFTAEPGRAAPDPVLTP